MVDLGKIEGVKHDFYFEEEDLPCANLKAVAVLAKGNKGEWWKGEASCRECKARVVYQSKKAANNNVEWWVVNTSEVSECKSRSLDDNDNKK